MPSEQGKPKLRLDHLAVWVEDIDKTACVPDRDGWLEAPPHVVDAVSAEDETTGGMKSGLR